MIVLIELLVSIYAGNGRGCGLWYLADDDSESGAFLGFSFAVDFEFDSFFFFLCIGAEIRDNGALFFIWH